MTEHNIEIKSVFNIRIQKGIHLGEMVVKTPCNNGGLNDQIYKMNHLSVLNMHIVVIHALKGHFVWMQIMKVEC